MNYRLHYSNARCKRDNPKYFHANKDRAHGVKERTYLKMENGRQYMYELQVLVASDKTNVVSHTIRELTTGWTHKCRIGHPMTFKSKEDALQVAQVGLQDDRIIIEAFKRWADESLSGGSMACSDIRVCPSAETGERFVVFMHNDGENSGTKRFTLSMFFGE